MGKINVLSADTAALIAAGEVVERPASVIKELVENSVDAGAESITVEIKNGGISYIRVTDDGEGIGREDVPLAFLRHATSKIKASADLENINTLGFRGEALYSIAAVSQLSLITARDGEEGSIIEVSGGEISPVSEAGCPKGTTITVRNLFFNTPARMKFLKKDSSEALAAEEIVRKIALINPHISFRFINGGKEIFFTPGDNSLKNCVHAIYGKEIASGMIDVLYEEGGIKVSGLVGKAEITRGNRGYQTFYVNGRCIINKNLSAVLAEAYKDRIMGGRFPVCVLNIELSPSLCDVNVHPAKTEVKFADDRAVSGAVYWAAKNALHAVSEQREIKLDEKTEVIKPVFEEKKETAVQTGFTFPKYEKKPYAVSFDGLKNVGRVAESDIPATIKPAVTIEKVSQKETVTEKAVLQTAEEFATEEPEKNIKVLGQLFDTYLVAEVNDEMVLCDQHAAHERIIYNRLLERDMAKNTSQTLLMPEIITLSPSDFSVYCDNEEFFRKAGFDAEEFGHNTVKISMIPESIDFADTEKAFSDMIEILSAGREKITVLQDKALYSLACKAALKAGKVLSRPEQETLIREIYTLEGEVTCPHGRPVILRMGRQQIEKHFKRIV